MCVSLHRQAMNGKVVSICLGFLIIMLSAHLSFLSFRWWMGYASFNYGFAKLKVEEYSNGLEIESNPAPPPSSIQLISCDRSHSYYDACTLSGPTVMNPITSTFSITGPNQTTQKLRPYPGKWNTEIMLSIKELTLHTTPSTPTARCHHKHDAPALVFSTGGLVGNVFHDFGDVLVPLFITLNLLFHNREPPVFVVTDYREWWLPKYNDIIRQLTPHPIINLDNETDTHCFPSAQIGLLFHCFVSVDSALMLHSQSILDFRALLDRSYSYYYNLGQAISLIITRQRPRLVLAKRRVGEGRVITNHDELVRVAEEVGFDVVNLEPDRFTPLHEIYKVINRSHAMFGVHGAALTHFLFLRPGSVLIQVVPLGIDWLAEICFGKAARQLGLEYMEHKIRGEESSLGEEYRKADFVLRDQPKALWDIYLRKQDVKLDLVRVRSLLHTAFNKATRFMNNNNG